MKRIQKKKEDEKIHIDPYHELCARTYESLLKERIILLNGEVKETIIEKIAIPLMRMSKDRPRTPITILINSEGGNVDDGQAVVDIIQQIKTPVITVGLGKVMSIAFDIFLAGDLRVSAENTLFLCHSGTGGTYDRLPMINDVAALNKKYFDRWAKYYAKRTSWTKTAWTYKQWYDVLDSGKDYYFFPEEAQKIGIVMDIQPAGVLKLKPKSARKRSAKSRKRQNRKKSK